MSWRRPTLAGNKPYYHRRWWAFSPRLIRLSPARPPATLGVALLAGLVAGGGIFCARPATYLHVLYSWHRPTLPENKLKYHRR